MARGVHLDVAGVDVVGVSVSLGSLQDHSVLVICHAGHSNVTLEFIYVFIGGL